MDSIISYFENIPSLHRTIILVGGLMFFWILEGFIPLVKFKYDKIRHAGINLFFTLTTLIINLIFAFLIVKSSDWTGKASFGILNWIQLSFGLKIVLGLMILDFIGAYLIHWIEHKVYWMWKFHVIHHTDTKVDATTALRHHPGESIFRAIFTIIAVLIAGAPIWLVMIYQSFSALLSQFNHANFQLPSWLEKYIMYIIVTPRMHRIHHHYQQPYTDTNYGNIFSIWDRIFSTFARLPTDKIIYGLDVFDKRENHIGDLLKLPVDGDNYHQK